jgi:hypothetical protein
MSYLTSDLIDVCLKGFQIKDKAEHDSFCVIV